jgi:hypothetical protein
MNGETNMYKRYDESSEFARFAALAKTLQAASAGGDHGQTPEEATAQSFLNIFDAYERRIDRVARIRFENLTKRSDAHYHWVNCQQYLESLQRSESALSASLSVKKHDSAVTKPKTRRRALHNTMKSDLNALQEKIRELSKMMKELMDHNGRIQQAEEALDNACRALFSAFQRTNAAVYGLQHHRRLSDVSLASTDQSQPTSVDVGASRPPQLSRLIYAVGEYHIMRERVYELELEFEDQLVGREQQADQGLDLDQTDDEFHQTWQSALQDSNTSFEAAHDELQQAKNLCIEANVDFSFLEEPALENGGDHELNRLVVAGASDNVTQQGERATSSEDMNQTGLPRSYRRIWQDVVVKGRSSQPFYLLHDFDESAPREALTARVGEWVDNVIPGNVLQPDDRVIGPGETSVVSLSQPDDRIWLGLVAGGRSS